MPDAMLTSIDESL